MEAGMITLKFETRSVKKTDFLFFSFEGKEGKEVSLSIKEEINSIKKQMTRIAEISQLPVIIDFSNVTLISVLFLNTLLIFQKKYERVFLCGLSPSIKEALYVTKLNQLFPILDSVEEAILEIEKAT